MFACALPSCGTPLQIALGMLIHHKKLIVLMHDYNVTCSYGVSSRWKYGCRCVTELWNSVVARYNNLRNAETVPVVIDRFLQYVDRGTPNVQTNCLCTLVTPDVALFGNCVLYGHWSLKVCITYMMRYIGQWSLKLCITDMMRYTDH